MTPTNAAVFAPLTNAHNPPHRILPLTAPARAVHRLAQATSSRPQKTAPVFALCQIRAAIPSCKPLIAPTARATVGSPVVRTSLLRTVTVCATKLILTESVRHKTECPSLFLSTPTTHLQPSAPVENASAGSLTTPRPTPASVKSAVTISLFSTKPIACASAHLEDPPATHLSSPILATAPVCRASQTIALVLLSERPTVTH